MKRLFTFVFPIYNWGQAAVFVLCMLPVLLIALFDDPDLALHLGVGAYLGVVASMFVLGLAPDEMTIEAEEIGPLVAALDAARLLVRIGDRVWAPKRYQSWWWESDRISIVERPDGSHVLKGRRRDLKIIRGRLRV